VSEPSMTEGFCRITVVSPLRKVDLTLPADLACAELLPEVVRLSGESDQGPPPLHWRLGRLGEPPLRPERTLSQSGVYDGDLLYLRAAGQPDDPAVVEDLVDTIAEAVDTRGGQWRASTWHRFAMVTAGALIAAAAGALAGAGGRGRAELAGAAAGAAVGLSLAALGLGRRLGQPVAAAALALAALPWWALAAGVLAGRPGVAPAVPVTAAAGGLLAGALAAAATVPVVAGPGLAVALPAASLALCGAAVVVAGATPVEAAAVLAVGLVPAVTALPRLAIGLAGISGDDEDAEVAVQAERTKVAVGHTLLAWLLGGAAVTLAAALALLAGAGGTLGRCLAGAVIVAIGLRARAFRLVGEILPLALAALGGLVALEVAIAADRPAGPPRHLLAAGLLAGTAAVLVLAGFVFRRAGPSPAMRRRLDLLDALANLLLVPLGLGVLGLYGAVERLAQRLGG
jgi:type VII secretion integral membrane protein EccD